MESLAGLRVFTMVVDAGNFSEVGRQLSVAPSSISRQINDLEEVLGTRLFQRSTRRLSLTEAGELYFDYATRIINEVDEAKLAISQLDGSPTGILRLNVPGSLSRRHIVPLLIEFQKTYPAVEVVLMASDQVVDMIENRIDLTVRIGALSDSSLVARKIGAGKRILCTNKEYLKTYGEPKHPQDLEQHNCLTFRSNPGHNLWRFKDNKGKSIEVRATGSLFANDGDSLVAAAAQGHGIIYVPEWLVSCELKEGSLEEILTDWSAVPSKVPLYALYPKQRYLAPKVRAFIDYLIERF